MATSKPNYTETMTNILVELYEAGTPIEEIAADTRINRPVRSVRTKLVSLGKWKSAPKEVKTAKADKGPTKKEIIANISKLINADDKFYEGIKNASIPALTTVYNFILANTAENEEVEENTEAA